ncbi:MAG: MFS transporter [Beutenbergiaceae bacterium]
MTHEDVSTSTIDDEPAPVPARVVRAWTIWDFGQQSFNSVILTFVYSVYVTGLASDPDYGAQLFSNTQAWAGLAIALLAPAVGTMADRARNSRLWLAITTLATIACMAGLWFVRPEESYLLLGCILIAVASVFSELANVFYYAMLLQVSTPKTYGRISGTAWGLGYIGGVIALVISLFGFILDGRFLPIPADEAMNVRGVALLCAAWFLIFGLPLLLWAPKDPPAPENTGAVGLLQAYRELGARIVRLWRSERKLLHFFVASAVYRDGLGAVFALAGVLAASAYGFPQEEVIYFGLAANLVAGISTWLAGKLDDRFGPRPVIVGFLSTILVVAGVIIVSDAKLTFWIGGLVIASCVGPVQTASRSMLARMTKPETANENFGLYATAGRAVSFMGPGAFAIAIAVTGQTRLGIIGIAAVLAFGLALFLSMRWTERSPHAG